MLLGYLILREYLMPSRVRTIAWKLFHAIIFLSAVGGVICIIIARGHYLIDIILAYFFTTRVFWIYHTLVYNHFLGVIKSNHLLFYAFAAFLNCSFFILFDKTVYNTN